MLREDGVPHALVDNNVHPEGGASEALYRVLGVETLRAR